MLRRIRAPKNRAREDAELEDGERALRGVCRRKWTTTQDRRVRGAPDLVKRNFQTQGPDQLWVDLTYVPTWSGFLFVAVVLDAWSRRVVGWAFANHLRAVFEFMEGWYNLRRRHSALHYLSPMNYELKYLGVTQNTSPNLSTETG